ncbi:MAG: electron transfer flavoprotein subunit beta/FixA family protein [Magnetococcales bacterium]|nr:electron transfer flavoprotein subunit beta/FixA family protein [Magnetococcales bacterium]
MIVLVAIKQIPDPLVPVRVKADGSGVEIHDARPVANPVDDNALEAALRLRESGAAQGVIAVCVGPPEWEGTLRTALAMGADRGIRIDAPDALDPWPVARLLAALAVREGVSLILAGRQAVDRDQGMVGLLVAGLLGWGQVAFASGLEWEEETGRCRVLRVVDGGQEVVTLRLPGVITVDPRLNTPRYASLPAIMRARGKSLESVSPGELGENLSSDLEWLSVFLPAARKPGVRVGDVAELAACLRALGVVACRS